MIRICHIVDTLNIGGLEKTLIKIVLHAKDFQHIVFCLTAKGLLAQELENNGVEVKEFNFPARLHIPSLFRLAGELKKSKINIVHCHGLYPSIWGRLAALIARIPVRIVHVQNMYYGISFKERLKLKILSNFTNRIIAVSEAVKKCLVDFVGITPLKVEVIYNSAANILVNDSGQRQRVRKSLGIADSEILIGSVARLAEHKGQNFLIEAIAQGKAKQLACKCLIVGDGPTKEKLELRVKELNLEDGVIFLGTRQDVEELLLGMDIFVQPSTVREGLALGLAEAASAGLCLVATDVGGNPEIVKDGFNGFIVPAKDAGALAEKIIFLAEHENERRQMGENSRKVWQEKFSLDEMVAKITALYKDEISKHYHS